MKITITGITMLLFFLSYLIGLYKKNTPLVLTSGVSAAVYLMLM